ncbi:hypothetical protein [Kitasatospora sp. NPDC059673]|uniref:hypothetical protein n=1 Tax=Kitasatospora sp. NPDC059673 TaxID=3346901 RepID=UPI00369E7854
MPPTLRAAPAPAGAVVRTRLVEIVVPVHTEQHSLPGADHRAVSVLHALSPRAGRGVELGVLVAANAAATLLRAWVFDPRRSS